MALSEILARKTYKKLKVLIMEENLFQFNLKDNFNQG